VFCIGLNKTGTTSIEAGLKQLGYRMGDQLTAEMMLADYGSRKFAPLIEYCNTADAFQDAPFSFPFTYVILDHYFPNARFILSVRDSADQWYSSLVNFHSKKFGHGKVPTREDLIEGVYRYKGFPWEVSRTVFNTPEEDPYNREVLINYYNTHNSNVREYFRMKNNFLEINISDGFAYKKMCAFLNKTPKGEDFLWLNKT
jgi:triacylglycerol esterase/lipase EstA (alpha/beta hydrolase family)